jgi:ArsR family transcriptional regulator, arsenate/arsenite/antimonite-responsive transcriptional repressor
MEERSYESMNVDASRVRSVRRLNVIDSSPAECCAPLDAPRLSDDDAETTALVFKALADPHRVRIVNLLANADEPVCVCNLTPQLNLAQPTVSFHLKKLAQAGLLEREQRGVWAYYSVNREALGRLASVFELEEVPV